MHLFDLVEVREVHHVVRPVLVLLLDLVLLLHVEQHLVGGARGEADVERGAGIFYSTNSQKSIDQSNKVRLVSKYLSL